MPGNAPGEQSKPCREPGTRTTGWRQQTPLEQWAQTLPCPETIPNLPWIHFISRVCVGCGTPRACATITPGLFHHLFPYSSWSTPGINTGAQSGFLTGEVQTNEHNQASNPELHWADKALITQECSPDRSDRPITQCVSPLLHCSLLCPKSLLTQGFTQGVEHAFHFLISILNLFFHFIVRILHVWAQGQSGKWVTRIPEESFTAPYLFTIPGYYFLYPAHDISLDYPCFCPCLSNPCLFIKKNNFLLKNS